MQHSMNWTRMFIGIFAGLGCVLAMASAAHAQDLSALMQVTKNRAPRPTGFVEADPAKYKALRSAPRTRGFLPAKVDLSGRFPVANDQGQQSSCSAWAVGYAARSYYVGKETRGEWGKTGENIASPAYIYNTLNKTGNCHIDIALLDALELLKNQGAVPISVTGYSETDCVTRVPPAVLKAHANRFRVQDFTKVEGGDENAIKSQLARDNPVIFAINLTEEFDVWERSTSTFTSKTKSGKKHAMVITGYDDERKAYKFINSWGDEWGDKGYGWITYEATKALWIEGYTLIVGPVKADAAQSPVVASAQQ